MSIRDDMSEEHLTEMNVCFVCHAQNDENGDCSICNNPETYENQNKDNSQSE